MKIFLVVGSLFPFDRLVKEIDSWISRQKNNIKVIGQIGNGKYVPQHFEYYKMLDAEQFNRIFQESDLIITHAGMGIILKSLVSGKPILVFPRRLKYKETTTEHQLATARALEKKNYVNIAWEEKDLLEYLEFPEKIQSKTKIAQFASDELIKNVKKIINTL